MPSTQAEAGPVKRVFFSLFVKIVQTFQGKGLTRIPGVSFIYDMIYKTLNPRGIIRISCQGSTMYVNSKDKGLVPFLVKGIHEEPLTDLIHRLIRPGMVFTDIGANIGYFTLIAARLMKGEGRIYAFEPDPNNYELLVKNIEANRYDYVTAVPMAVTNAPGKLVLFLDRINYGGSSLSRENIPQTGASIEVETTTLDHYFRNVVGDMKVDLIKVDAQGAEGLIFEGAENILRSNDLKIIMEFWPFGLENMGTDPRNLLQLFYNDGFRIKIIDEEGNGIHSTDIEKLIERCKHSSGGRGDVNLLLEK